MPVAVARRAWTQDSQAIETCIKSNKYRERQIFEPIGQVDNHEQTLFAVEVPHNGLAYRRS
jgi:hypothetical protein